MRIGIVGLGLIGGSLGIDLRAKGYYVVGLSRRSQTCERAIAKGAIDRGSTEPEILRALDLVFLCPPIGSVLRVALQITPYLSRETVLTDVASVKGEIVPALEKLWPRYVGGHPMAGTAASGIEAAQAHLFANAPYVLTPTLSTDSDALDCVAGVVNALGAKLLYATPADHDRAVAWISHLPVLVSAALLLANAQEANEPIRRLAQQLASSGFRDTSRVGGGNPELGRMMAEYNRTALRHCLSHYRATLDDLIRQVEQEDWERLQTTLEQAQAYREQVYPSETSPVV
ncbi:prephenate/arogenate dehydrogenase [uncultured Thermosynechococcus sp.]|uniref:prephenate/arogenate dehydrogenase n=1 Tax=uncultured Thermosynechococcus sp. TaxID=436945 RepID=UPI003428F998